MNHKLIYKMINKTIISVLLFTSFTQFSLAQNNYDLSLSVGNNIIENYSNSFLNRPTSIWSILRSSQNKMIYYGTYDGILEYNGKYISSISIDGNIEEELETSYVRKIIEDENGLIYAAGRGVFGKLVKNKFGKTIYQSFMGKIPDSINPYNQFFWGAVKQKSNLFLYTRERVFKWNGSNFEKIWKISDPKEGIDAIGTIQTLIKVKERIFIRVFGKGIFELKENSFELLKNSNEFINNRVESAHMVNDKIIFFSSNNGAYEMNDKGEFKKIKNKILNRWLIENKIYNTEEIKLFKDNRFPLISLEGGVLILDEKLKIVDQINQKDGLFSNTITSFFIDVNDDLYLTSLLTSSKVKMNKSLTTYNQSDGIKGLVRKIKRLNNQLFFSTTEDIFKVNYNSNPLINNELEDIGIDDIPKSFISLGGTIISANNLNLSATFNNKKTIISNDRLIQSPQNSLIDENLLIVAHPIEGIIFFKKYKNNFIKKIKSIKVYDKGIIGLKEISPGKLYIELNNGEGSFIATYDKRLNISFKRILTPENQKIIDEKQTPSNKLLNSDLIDFFEIAELNFFETEIGYLVFDDNLNLYSINENLNLIDLQIDLFPIFENLIDFDRQSIISDETQFTSLNNKTKNNWFLQNNGVMEVKFNKSGYEILDTYPYGSIDKNELSGAFLSEKYQNQDLLWLGSKDSKIISWMPKKYSLIEKINVYPIIQSISFNENIKDLSETNNAYNESRNIKFSYTYPSFEKVENNLYRVRLTGQDEKWNNWSKSTESTYNNLWEGDYNFELQAMDTNGDMSEIVSYKFSISPPWYRTYLAYAIYILITVLSIRFFGKFQAKKSLEKSDNERRVKELEEAKKIQESMLPKKFPELSDLDIAAGLITSTEVGGDYYDYFLEDNGEIYIVCGDATGHGTAAGMMVSIIKSALNGLPILPVNKILERLNKIVKKIDLGRLKMSLTVSKIKGNKLFLSSAAMPPTYLFNVKNKNCEEIMIQGLPLGGLTNETFKLYENKFSKGDILVMISDGLPEAENENSEMYNYDRIKDVILKNSNQSANKIKNSLLDELSIWLKGGIPDDDATVVVIKKC